MVAVQVRLFQRVFHQSWTHTLLCAQQCSLACHKKCLETLAIQCGHKKLQGRLQLFGIDFAQASRNSPDGIPFIIKKCTSEIESRALNIKVNCTQRNLFEIHALNLPHYLYPAIIVICSLSGMSNTLYTWYFWILGYLSSQWCQIAC